MGKFRNKSLPPKNVFHLQRSEYKEMLDCGILFRNWHLYEPERNPKKSYYIIHLGNNITLNKTEIDN